MSTVPQVALTLSDSIVREIVQVEIASRVTEALVGKDQLIQALVKKVLDERVDAHGKVNDSSYYNTNSFIDVTVKNAILEQTRKAIIDWVTQKSDTIKTMIEKMLVKETTGIAKAMVNSLLTSATNNYRVKISFDEKDKD